MLKGSTGLLLRAPTRYCSPASHQCKDFASDAPFALDAPFAPDAPSKKLRQVRQSILRQMRHYEVPNYGEYNVRLPWLASDAPTRIVCVRCAT